MELLNIEAKLAVEQVAEAIVEAVLQGRHDLTMAPDEGTATLLQITQNDPDKAERLVGQTFHERLQQLSGGTTQT